MDEFIGPSVFTNEQAQEIDKRTINEYGIDGFTLMEIAATRASDFIKNDENAGIKGLILCGKGNNGGDALATARHLVESGYELDIFFVFGKGDLSADTSKNANLLEKLNNPNVTFIDSIESQNYDFVIDGILGSGLNGELNSDLIELVNYVNNLPAICYSCDIPTGINGDTGQIMGAAIEADITFMFGTRKQGCYLDKGFDHCGLKVFCELPFPKFLVDEYAETHLMGFESPNIEYAHRKHKYSTPPVYVIGGSKGLTGAAILAAKAAWSAGAGAVTSILPGGIYSSFDAHFVEIMRVQVGNAQDFHFKPEHLDLVFDTLHYRPGIVLLGPGLGRHEETQTFVREFLKKSELNCVVDADALFALGEYNNKILNKNAGYVFTPHAGEFGKLFGEKPINSSQIRKVLNAAKFDFNNVMLVKGRPVHLVHQTKTLITGYDTSLFNRAGFGDVLAGFTASFWSLTNNAYLSPINALIEGKNRLDSYISNNNKTNKLPGPTAIL